ncbi:type II secretion system F family protein [Methylocucumis oryzae]|uniref:type II secretion system F family protein n=1 Tax=Methylocucumis oryzae TaxID=1632867 RepID=UPI000A95AB68|nr:type II secretion system F family protein [Methylocucumis oryzae]
MRRDRISEGWAKLTDRIERAGISLVDTQGDKLRARLIAAGYNFACGSQIVHACSDDNPIPLTGNATARRRFWWFGNFPDEALYIRGFASDSSLYLPNLFISAKADRRREEIINGFPDALDLMLVCVEAGLGMEAAFDRVGREMLNSHPLLSELLSMVTLELRAGATREQSIA